MSDDRNELHARASEIFDEALEIDPEARAAWLDRQCADDAELRREVDSLLAALGDASAFLETPITAAAHGRATSMVGKHVSGYLIERVIAVGGMGAVYLARQESPSRQVALKLIKPGLYSRRVLRRFEHEGDLLGRLQHPGIAQIFEAGRTEDDDSQPYLAMEYIEGRSLTEYIAENDLGTRDRLDLMARICDATHHAHQKGIIHRDLKPANILVDSYGNPKILDFGIARFTDADIETVTGRTDVGELIGTVPYMSPEQVTGDPDELDTRSDVYSLGVLLYEVLAGSLPYDIRRKSVLEAVRIIRDEDPTPLSAFGTVFRGDLETIVAKALEKEKARRYGSASDLAADMRHYLQDEPIVARPASASYQLRKFARRHRGIVGGSLIALVMLVAGIATTTVAWMDAEEARRLEAHERADAIDARNRESVARRAAERERIQADRARDAAIAARMEEHEQRTAADLAREQEERQREAADAARDEAAREAETAAAINRFMTIVLAGPNPWIETPYSVPARNVTMVEVLDRAERSVAEELREQTAVEAGVRNTIGIMYRNLGRHREAEEQLRRAHELRTEVLGEDHRDTVLTLHWLGLTIRALGDFAEAEKILRRSVALRSRVLGPAHPTTLESLTALAGVLIERAKYDEAERTLLNVLKTNEAGARDFEVRYTTNYVLAGLYQLAGNSEEALRRTREALEAAEAAHGVGHARTLIPLFQLGHLQKYDYTRQDEAERRIRAAVDGAREAFGEDHPQTLFFMRSHASLLHSMGGRAREAEDMLRHVVREYRRQLGDGHLDSIESMVTLGRILGQKGSRDEARELLGTAAARAREVLGTGNRVTANAVLQLGNFEREGDDLDAAEALLREAVELNRATRGEDSMFTAFALQCLSSTMFDKGDIEESETLIREAIAINMSTRGGDHPQTTENQVRLARILERQGKSAEAGELLNGALAVRKRGLGDAHPATVSALRAVAEFRIRQGRESDAEDLLRRSLDGMRAAHGALHSSTLATAFGLESLLRKQGRLLDLVSHYTEILEAADSPQWRDDPAVNPREIASYRGGLGVCLVKLDRHDEAVPVLLESLNGFLGTEATTQSAISHGEAANVARTLIAAYEKLGEDEKAASYRARLPGH